jgi:hypothetical protein
VKPLLAALAAVLALAVGTPVATAAPVAPAAPDRLAWHDGACAPDDNVGVTVVVDFQDLGGGVNVRCTETAPTDGADALDRAGISWQGVVRWGRGFVCKIAGKPANDPCIDTPPASAYWSYWIAPRGGEWCYSNFGVLNRRPPPGSVEGWSFSRNEPDGTSPKPGYAPPKLAAGLAPNPLPKGDCDPGGGTVGTAPPTTAPPTPTTRPTTPTTRPTSGGGGGMGATPTTPDGLPAPTLANGQPVPTTKPGATTSSSSTSTTDTKRTTTTTATANGKGEGKGTGAAGLDSGQDQNQVDLSVDGTEQEGFPLATVLGVAGIAVLGAAAWLAQRHRRLRIASAETSDPFELG